MLDYVNRLQEQQDQQLLSIEEEEVDTWQKAKRSATVMESILDLLKNFIRTYTFVDKDEEIRYFKEIQPKFQSELMFFIALSRLERGRPPSGRERARQYLQQRFDLLHLFFLDNEQLYQYYRTGANYFDSFFFTKSNDNFTLIEDEYSHSVDSHFCTAYGIKIAGILANNRLQDYIAQELDKLDHNNKELRQPQAERAKYAWTDTKAALSEQILAWYYKGCINHGQAKIKDIQEMAEEFFGIKLGNIYRTKQELYIRENMASFLESTLKRYKEGMDESDERNRSR